MSYETVMKSLHNHTPVSVYLITGDQAYLVNRLKNAFTALIPEEERTMNFASYDMESTPIAQA